jgi:AcrR family transcriptional regulator
MEAQRPRLSGRRGQAARNDERILAAAREVFIGDPNAPISAVAARADVGISALYRRWPSKEDLLRQLCRDGLRVYLDEAEAAIADRGDPWHAFATFLHRVVEADVHSLTVRLAGTFTPTEDMNADARRSGELNERLVARTKAAGDLRDDVTAEDLTLILEQLAAIRPGIFGDARRTTELRERYLALILDGLRSDREPLPGPPPSDAELGQRWARRR